MTYLKSDMFYNDYRWMDTDNEVQVKAASVFQPDNGNIILYLINELTANILDSKILEIIIHEYLPKSIRTINHVMKWIKEKGDMYYKIVLRSIVKDD